jgi:hypothetical protein
MSTEPFLPAPEPVAPSTTAKKATVKTLVLWAVLIAMFLGIWQFLAPGSETAKPQLSALPACEPSPWWVTMGPIALGPCVLGVALWFFLSRAYGQRLEFNLTQEPGRLAVAERRFGAAIEVFARTATAYAKSPGYAVAASLSLGYAQLWSGDLPRALETFATIEKKRLVIFSSSVRTLAAVNLAFAHALAGQLEAAERWCAEARTRIAKNRDDRLEYASRLCLAEATVALRRGRVAEAGELLEKNWSTIREVLNANTVRAAEILRAFVEVGGGVRQSNTSTERLIRVEPVLPGEFAFLGVQWPEMDAFLAAHGLGAREPT